LIACFLSNISAKYYENPTMLSRVIAKNIGDVFFETQCRWSSLWQLQWARSVWLGVTGCQLSPLSNDSRRLIVFWRYPGGAAHPSHSGPALLDPRLSGRPTGLASYRPTL